MKKWLGLLMVCCMLFTMMQPLAMASSSSAPTIAIGSVEVAQGSTDTQAVTVSIKNNPGLAALKIRVSYPTDTLELKSAEQGDIGSKFKDASFVTDNGVGNWNILSDKENVTGDGTLVTLTFAAKAGAQAGEYEISAKVEEAYDVDDKDVTFTVEKGAFKVVTSTASGGGSSTTSGGTDGSTTSSGTVVAFSSVEVAQGSTDTKSVTLSIKNNPGLAALKIRVSYPTDTLELKSAEQGDIGSKFKDASFVTDNGVGNWNILSDKKNVTGDGTLVTLTFAAKAGAQAGEYEISAKVEEAYDVDDKNVTFTVEKGAFKVVASTTSGGGSSTTSGGTDGSTTSSGAVVAFSSVEVAQGSTDTKSVTVSIKNNPGLAALKIRVSYPTDTLELKSAEQGDIGSKFKDASFVTDNGVGNWNILSDKENVTGDGTLVTLTFAAKAGTQAGEYEISAKVEEAYDVDDKNVTFTVEKGVFKVVASTTSGGGSTASGDKYNVTVVTPTNGTVTPDKTTAAKDETVTLTVAPNTGYELDTITVNGASASIETTKASDTTYTFAMPGEAVTVTATFKATTPEPAKYDVTVSAATGGTVKADKDKAAKDETVTLTVTPDAGYKLDKLTVNGAEISGTTFKMPAEKAKVEATFVVDGGGTPATEYDIEYVTPQNGKISGAAKAAADTTVTVTATPDPGYKLDKLTVNGNAITGTTFQMPAEKAKVEATFVVDGGGATEYDIEYVTPQNGKISGAAKAAADTTVTVTVEPDPGYKFSKLTVNDRDITGTSFTMPAAKATVSATFEKVEEYAITYEKAEHGKISGVEKAAADADVSVNVEPDEGYKLDKLTVNGEAVSGTTFKMPAGKATVSATFVVKPPQQGCYIATSVYGSYDTPEVWTLRRFRDDVLGQTWYGRLFIKAYYATSPTLVRLFGDAEWFQNFWREKLDGLVQNLQDDGFESTPYQDKDW